MKITTQPGRFVGVCVAFVLSVSLLASPLVTLSDNAAIYFDGSASISSDSNIALDSSNEIDDIIYEFDPGFKWVYGSSDTGAELTLNANYTIKRYGDRNEFDTELASVALSGQFQSAKSVTKVNAGYVENQTNTRDANTAGILLESAITSAGFNTDYEASLKTSVVAGISYTRTDQKTNDGFGGTLGVDRSQLLVPVNIYYAATEKLDVGLGYRYRNSSVDVNSFVGLGDRSSHFFNVALRGELSPKIIADMKFGFQTTDIEGQEKFDGFSADASLTYLPDAKTTLSFLYSRDYEIGFLGEAKETSMITGILEYVFNEQFSGNAVVFLASDDYKNLVLEQDYVTTILSLTYNPSQYLSVEGSYIYSNNDTTVEGSDFTGNIYKLGVNVRY